MRDEQELKSAMDSHADTVKRICMVYLKNTADTEDVFQNVFLKYYRTSAHFESKEHEKAWFIRVAINECKDIVKSFFRKTTVSLEDVCDIAQDTGFEQSTQVRQAVLSLPEKYKIVIYLHYFEGYTAVEIGKILNKSTNTIYTLMARGRELLKKDLGSDEHEW